MSAPDESASTVSGPLQRLLLLQGISKVRKVTPSPAITASTKVLSVNPSRYFIVFSGNVGNQIYVDIQLQASSTTGIPLPTDGFPLVFTSNDMLAMINSDWYAVSAGVGDILDVYEGFFVR